MSYSMRFGVFVTEGTTLLDKHREHHPLVFCKEQSVVFRISLQPERLFFMLMQQQKCVQSLHFVEFVLLNNSRDL